MQHRAATGQPRLFPTEVFAFYDFRLLARRDVNAPSITTVRNGTGSQVAFFIDLRNVKAPELFFEVTMGRVGSKPSVFGADAITLPVGFSGRWVQWFTVTWEPRYDDAGDVEVTGTVVFNEVKQQRSLRFRADACGRSK
jgi:hypothetical protein